MAPCDLEKGHSSVPGIVAILATMVVVGAVSVAKLQGPDGMPSWLNWLVASGHNIEDGRACGLVDPGEVDDMYVAVLMVSATVDGIALDRAEKVLRVSRDHARDTPVSAQTCREAEQALPALRAVLAPYVTAAKRVK